MDPKLSPGPGFWLGPDGKWVVKDIPHSVLDSAQFSGTLNVLGYRCSVFDAEGGSWAQKSAGTPKAAASMWKRPLLEDEAAELDRVSRDDSLDVEELRDAFKRAELRTLSDADWQRLENTDSYDVSSLDEVRQIAETYGRDVETILQGLGDGTPMPAPAVLERPDGSLTLVGGNTRLMAARALKLSPKVLWMSLRNTTVAARVAAKFLKVQADLVSQVGDILSDEREDVKYDKEIAAYCKEARKVLPKMDAILEKAFHSVFDLKSDIPSAKHPKVRQLCEEQLAKIVNEAAARVELVAHQAQQDVESLLATLEANASRTASSGSSIKLVKTETGRGNRIRQTWAVTADGQSVDVKSFTGDGGHLEFLTPDAQVTVDGTAVSAHALVQHVITRHPDYPSDGDSIPVDAQFLATM